MSSEWWNEEGGNPRPVATITATGVRVVVGRCYRWDGRTVEVTSLLQTTEGLFASIHEPAAEGDSRRNVSADELEALA